jgi:hypothetical protein
VEAGGSYETNREQQCPQIGRNAREIGAYGKLAERKVAVEESLMANSRRPDTPVTDTDVCRL